MPQPDTSNRYRRWLVVAVVGIAAFLLGAVCEHVFYGRWYDVHLDQTQPSPFGTVHLRHVTDTKGWPFLDPGDSVISLRFKTGPEVTLYQSKRVFQESWPWVAGVEVAGDELIWSDGLYRYTLRLEPLAPTTQPE